MPLTKISLLTDKKKMGIADRREQVMQSFPSQSKIWLRGKRPLIKLIHSHSTEINQSNMVLQGKQSPVFAQLAECPTVKPTGGKSSGLIKRKPRI